MRIVAIALVAATVVATVLILIAYQRDISAARERTANGSQIAKTACGPIEYASLGSGPVLLIVHGAGGGFDQALDMAAPLVASGLRVVLMSRFGYLRTPLPADASPAAQADAHACLLDALKIERAAILGASAGAPSALQFALRHAARCTALVLLVPAAYAPRPGSEAPLKTPRGTPLLFETVLRSDFLFWAVIRAAPRTVMRSILATPPEVVSRASAEERQRMARVMEAILPVSPRRQGLLNDAAIISTLGRYDLERISARTLAISTADDLFGTYETARYSAEHIPGARFIGFESGGHLWVGHHRELLAEIAGFVKR
jgi:2-hydroxy-6-oxonona-2,4-dienedioate hydrolase